MIVVALVLHLLWIATLFCAGFGMGWLLVTAVEDMRLPIFAAVGLGVLYLIFTGFLGQDVGNAIERLTGV